jgi:hypothetical protein
MTYFTAEQVSLLLKPIHPRRVSVRDGMSYVEGYDIKAELNRVLGFGRWSVDILDQSLICETETKTSKGKDAWYVVYKTSLRLTVCAPDGSAVARYEESHVGESTHPVRGEAHGNALTNSWTYALKRCATNLGDQFGLSLYGKGSMDALVRWTLVRPEAGDKPAAVNDDDVPQVTAEAAEVHGEPEAAAEKPAAPAESNGHAANGTAVRPAQTPRPVPQNGEPDKDAQAFADEAHQARVVQTLRGINTRAREAQKLASLIRNPATGGIGPLGRYLNHRRTVLQKAEKALADLRVAANTAGISEEETEHRLVASCKHGIEEASAEEMEQAAVLILKGAGVAA